MGISREGSFPAWSGGSAPNFPVHLGAGVLALNRHLLSYIYGVALGLLGRNMGDGYVHQYFQTSVCPSAHP